jgi:hypothetical protein
MSRIRRARPEEAQSITEVYWRSKAYWGYDEAFMREFRADRRITAEDIANDWVWIHEDNQGRIVGFYRLCKAEPGCISKICSWTSPPSARAMASDYLNTPPL